MGGFFSLESNLDISILPSSTASYALPEFGGGLELRFLAVRVDGLEHLRQAVAELGSADVQVLIRVEVVLSIGGLEVSSLGDGLFSLDVSNIVSAQSQAEWPVMIVFRTHLCFSDFDLLFLTTSSEL